MITFSKLQARASFGNYLDCTSCTHSKRGLPLWRIFHTSVLARSPEQSILLSSVTMSPVLLSKICWKSYSPQPTSVFDHCYYLYCLLKMASAIYQRIHYFNRVTCIVYMYCVIYCYIFIMYCVIYCYKLPLDIVLVIRDLVHSHSPTTI